LTSAGSPSLIPKRIAIFVATYWELKAVRSAFPPGIEHHLDGRSIRVCPIGEREYWLIQTGVGLENARQCAKTVLSTQSMSLMVSTGFACALGTAQIGELLVGRDAGYISGQDGANSTPIEVPGEEREAVFTFIKGMVPADRIGRFVSTDRIVGRASEKAELAQRAQAVGLDMESWALAGEAQHAHVPFVIIRSVSDLVDEDLPLDFNLFLKPTSWLKGLSTIVTNPSCLLGIGRLRRQSIAAGKALTDFFYRYNTFVETGQLANALSGAPR